VSALPAGHAAAPAVLVGTLGDRGYRWSPGGRLHHVFEDTCDRLAVAGAPDSPAVDVPDDQLGYATLDARANQLAHHLRRRGIGPGARVALLCDRPVATYTALLGALKAGAAYVPLDGAFPADRIDHILRDAGVDVVLATAGTRERLAGAAAPVLDLDEAAGAIAAEDDSRLPRDDAAPDDALCYVVYTSGTTGRPKGVMVDHSSICHFVRVAAECYGVTGDDRVYQGLTIAFDFSVEEIWVAWAVGATLVPRPPGGSLLGPDLHDFLSSRRVTALCCVPTLLATIEEDLPGLRFLLVSGEACPPDLVRRWHRPGRRFLNVYGPTEATVTATWSVVHPDEPVTLGRPLPGYAVVVLDAANGHALPVGSLGEIALAGIGLARGYAGRPDLTDRVFVPDRLGLPDNPSGRLYRTGDLGRVIDGEVEYHGRIDTQVKIRGYRIELAEVESVLLELPDVQQAVVAPHTPAHGAVELVAYCTRRQDSLALDPAAVFAHLRSRLPAYSVPAHLEELDVLPMTSSDKVDRAALPPPRGDRRAAATRPHVAPATPVEQGLAEVVGSVLGLSEVSVTSHLFDDLGADSLLLAHVCTGVRQRPDLPPISMKDVYQHPTVRSLAAALAVPGAGEAAGDTADLHVPPAPAPGRPPRRGLSVRCGLAQVGVFLAWSYLLALAVTFAHEQITPASGALETYERTVVYAGAAFLAGCLLPIVAKWVLIGRWKEERFPVWGVRYLRFWVVKALIRSSPLALFHGSPLTVLYLRALGARIGPGALVLTEHLPVCTDLLTIGAGAVVHKDATLNCYRVVDGVLETGPVSLGRNSLVSEQTLLDVRTRLGDRAELSHSSSLHPGQSVPDGERWVGSPAGPAGTPPAPVPPATCTTRRRLGYGALQLFSAVFIWTPLLVAATGVVLPEFDELGQLSPGDPLFYLDHAALASLLFWGTVLVGFVLSLALPRLLNRMLPADRVFPLYGWRWSLQRTTARTTNLGFYTGLFGDSSAIPYWLRAMGWDVSEIEQTGSNFGMAVGHEAPGLCAVGTGTMASDGLSMMNAQFSGTSFRVRRTAIGARNFLGNALVYPPDGRTGDNVLLGTKVHVPIDGPVRSDVGLLGSPPFPIPRSVGRDHADDRFDDPEVRRQALRAKNEHNAVTAALYLLVRWLHFVVSTLIAVVTIDHHGRWGPAIVVVGVVGALLFTAGWYLLIERIFRSRPPEACSIYDRAFWRHERYWKVPAMAYVGVFNGTPMKSLLWRAMGVRVGRRVFDDGCWLTERISVTLGDDTTLNEGSILQSHSLEDGVFKSGFVRLGAGVTVCTVAFAHYGVTIGDRAFLAPDSFLMKGESVGADERWGGNPARLLSARRPPASLLDQLRIGRLPGLPDTAGVTVELFDLAACRSRLGELTDLLPDDERQRAAAMGSPQRREAFVAGRALLRSVLSLLDPSRAPRDWPVDLTATGRPVVGAPGAPAVSLSAADGVVAVAWSTGHEVGVDVERLDGRDRDVVVDAVLTPAERRQLAAAPGSDRAALFLSAWTVKEAVLKCSGAGLPGGPEQVETTSVGSPTVHQERWDLPGRSYSVAVATAPRQSSRRLSSATTRSQRYP
jgi:non-ribosomal peptide synthetase-like protein